MVNLSSEMRIKSTRFEMTLDNQMFHDVITLSKEFHLNLTKDQLLNQTPFNQKSIKSQELLMKSEKQVMFLDMKFF